MTIDKNITCITKYLNLTKMRIFRRLASLLLLTVSSVGAASAQSYMFDNPENHPYFGARVGLDIATVANGGWMYSTKAGFTAGAVYNIPILMNLYFEPGLSVFYDAFGTVSQQNYRRPIVDQDGNIDYEKLPYWVNGTLRNFGFRIPMNFGYHFDFSDDLSVHVYTGPQINLSLVARYHQNEVITPDGVVESTSVNAFGTGGFKHCDLQWNFGAGVTYGHYYMSVGGSVGMTHMKSASEIEAGPYKVSLGNNIRRNLFNISVGYNF